MPRPSLAFCAALTALTALTAAAAVACGDATPSDDVPVEDDPVPRRGRGSSEPALNPNRDGSTELGSPAADRSRADASLDGSAADSGGKDGASPPPAPAVPPPPAPACKLDTRAVYTQDGRKIESITGYGRYWSRELKANGASIEGVGFPTKVTDEQKFSGPCGGRPSCALDSRAIWFDSGIKIESTTAYGVSWAWSFDAQGQPAARPGYPRALTATTAYRDGPCAFAGAAGAGGAACVLDTRSLEATSGGRVETITAYGRWFEYLVGANDTHTPRGATGSLLTSIPRLAAGACNGQSSAACVLDTRTIYTDLDGTRIEEVTARGRLWVYRLDGAGNVLSTPVDGTALVNIARFAGPCAH